MAGISDISFLKQFFNPRDLSEFQANFSLPAKPIAKVLGYNNGSDPGLEAELDVEYISAAGRNVDTWFISLPNPTAGGKEDFLTWIVGQVNMTNSPWVHSVSYGDDESTVPTRVEDEYCILGGIQVGQI